MFRAALRLVSEVLKAPSDTHNSTYQVPDIAWLKMGGGSGRRTQSEGGAYKKREKKEKSSR